MQYTTEDAAQEAIARFNGYELAGRALRVNEALARQRPHRPRGDWDGGA